MTRNFSGIPASPASPALTHLIQYTAITAGVEQHGIATITTADARIPWSALAAAVPGFVVGEHLSTDGATDERPFLLGPSAADMPHHPAWCVSHDDEVGDGTSVCLGEVGVVDCDADDPDGGTVSALLESVTDASPRLTLVVNGAGTAALTPAAAREFAALLLDLAAQAESGSAVSA